MQLDDDFISLREFKDDEKKVSLILDAALKKNATIYVFSTGSGTLCTLYSNDLQAIRSNYPQKAKVMLEEIIDPKKHRHPYVEHYQLISFSDLWITKIDLRKILPTPPVEPELKLSNSSEIERSTMLKLILGMAISAYNFDPQKDRNTATGCNKGSIKYDLAKLGLRLDEDTIRKYLHKARDENKHVRIPEEKKILQH